MIGNNYSITCEGDNISTISIEERKLDGKELFNKLSEKIDTETYDTTFKLEEIDEKYNDDSKLTPEQFLYKSIHTFLTELVDILNNKINEIKMQMKNDRTIIDLDKKFNYNERDSDK